MTDGIPIYRSRSLPSADRQQRQVPRFFMRVRQKRWGAPSSAPGFILIAILMILWETVARLAPEPFPNFPPLSEILFHWWVNIADGTLPEAVASTLFRMFAGYTASAAFGVSLGILIGTNRFSRRLLEPLIELLRFVPVSAFIPLLILFFGIGFQMKVWVAFVGASFLIILNTYAGVASVHPTLLETAATFRLSRLQTIREIILPAAAPSIFVGLRLALATALIISVLAEMIAGNSGIGYFILQGQQMLSVSDMYVGIFTLGVVGYAINSIFVAIERSVLRWHVSAGVVQ
jgi:ABC-type nitrate/sulfonate/bicarbonate transport system permease component